MHALLALLTVSTAALAKEAEPKRQPASVTDLTVESTLNQDGTYFTRYADAKNHIVCYALTSSTGPTHMPAMQCLKN